MTFGKMSKPIIIKHQEMSYITSVQLLYLCEKAVQQMVTSASLCYV